MNTLFLIVSFCLLGGMLSVVAATLITRLLLVNVHISLMVSFAVGAMLGAVFLEILPHAFAGSPDASVPALVILFGILGFFLLEKMVIWRHCHADDLEHPCEAHHAETRDHDHGRSGTMILIGDTFHNFVDGVLIAAAFLENTTVGLVTAMAIITHEVPQAMSNYLVLLHSGFSRVRALGFNLLASLAMLVGGLVAFWALREAEQWIPALLALAASSMIYVAVADLMPGLHKRTEFKATVGQMALIVAGVITVWAVPALLGGHEHISHTDAVHQEAGH